jgi:hypothetical protein
MSFRTPLPAPVVCRSHAPNCFIVRDANGQQLAYVYYESEPGRRSAAKLLTKDEARRIAANIDCANVDLHLRLLKARSTTKVTYKIIACAGTSARTVSDLLCTGMKARLGSQPQALPC